MMDSIVDTLNSFEEEVEQEKKPDFQSNLAITLASWLILDSG